MAFRDKYNHVGPVLGYSWHDGTIEAKDKRRRVCTDCVTRYDDFDVIITQTPPRNRDKPQCDRCATVLGFSTAGGSVL